MDKLNIFKESEKAFETIDICTTLIAQFDEQSIIPIIFTLEDTIVSYYVAKYRNEGLTKDDIEGMKTNVHNYFGFYDEMDESTIKMYDNSKINIKKKEVKPIE